MITSSARRVTGVAGIARRRGARLALALMKNVQWRHRVWWRKKNAASLLYLLRLALLLLTLLALLALLLDRQVLLLCLLAHAGPAGVWVRSVRGK